MEISVERNMGFLISDGVQAAASRKRYSLSPKHTVPHHSKPGHPPAVKPAPRARPAGNMIWPGLGKRYPPPGTEVKPEGCTAKQSDRPLKK